MATNWNAYEAAKEIMGNNKENIAEIGSRYPLFTRTVSMANNEYLLDILKAIPKVTARVVETGLKDMEVSEDAEETKEEKKVTPKSKQTVEDEDDWDADTEEDESDNDYDSMTAKELYALCCKRGISSLCKSRSKSALIELLTKLDNGEIEPKSSKGGKKADTKKTEKKAAQKVEEDTEDEDWGEDDEEETDPYAGKTAMELFKMCKERGIKAKPKQKADAYVKLLKADDENSDSEEDTEEDEDDWEI